MRILITGGSGFIGSRLTRELLRAGHEVRVLDLQLREEFRAFTVVGDIRNPEDCRRAMADAEMVIHLAALFGDDVSPRELYYEVNRDGTFEILRACTDTGVRKLIFVSSFSVYGLNNASSNEDSVLSPVSDYGWSKAQAEKGVQEWVAADPTRAAAVIRPSVVFGEGNRGNVYTLAREIHRGRFVLLGSGANIKSIAYVGNLVAFMQYLLDRLQPGITCFNYADKPDMPVREIVRIIGSAMGRRVPRLPIPLAPVRLLGRAGDAAQRLFGYRGPVNSARVEKFFAQTFLPTDRVVATGFVPPYPLAESLAETIRFEFVRSAPEAQHA